MTFKRTKKVSAFVNREELTAFKLLCAINKLNQSEYILKLVKTDAEKNEIDFEKGIIMREGVKK